MEHYLTVREVAAALRISEHAVRDCIRAGAPVYRWGAAGRQYRIVLDEFVEWMTTHGAQEHEKRQSGSGDIIQMSAAQMADRRHQLLRTLGGASA